MRTLFTRRWLTALAVATAFFVACLFLGRWQWGRHLDKTAAAAAVSRNYAAAPVPLDQALPAGSTLTEDRVWTRITATGTYDRGHQLMVRNRPQNVVYGYEVLDPLRLDDGSTVLVDRGWVKNGPTAETLPAVPDPPSGHVTVTGWLRQGEESLGRELPAGQLGSINLAEASAAIGAPVRPAYVVLEKEDDGSGREPARPTPLLPPDTDTGPHFGYALQWWGGSVVGFVIVFVYLRREVRDREAVATGATPRAPKPKRTRIWDEEDE